MNKKLTAKIKSLPQKPGAYIFKDKAGRILYIGKAVNLRNRVRSHFAKSSDIYKGDLIKDVADIDFIITADEKEALILENNLIKKYQPRYNIQWRDDKSYFWVNFTDDDWPRVQVVHNRQALSAKRQAPNIGPFTNGRELKQVLRALRKILPYRTCKNAYDKPCLQWHLGLCPAHLRQGYGGQAHCHQSLAMYRSSLSALRQLLRLYAGEALRVEAYDISNIQGTSATGSMIVFKGFKPDKSQYRKFRIKTVRGANDIAMLKEILRRRLNHREWPVPGLILIDGGRAQLNAASAIVGNQMPLMALAKQEEELYTIYSNKALRLNALPIDLRLLFQAVRNEAHRFAIAYYRRLHGKKFKRRVTPKRFGE